MYRAVVEHLDAVRVELLRLLGGHAHVPEHLVARGQQQLGVDAEDGAAPSPHGICGPGAVGHAVGLFLDVYEPGLLHDVPYLRHDGDLPALRVRGRRHHLLHVPVDWYIGVDRAVLLLGYPMELLEFEPAARP